MSYKLSQHSFIAKVGSGYSDIVVKSSYKSFSFCDFSALLKIAFNDNNESMASRQNICDEFLSPAALMKAELVSML